MKIGLDLSVLQTPHRMRGIGSVTINFVKHISKEAKKEHQFVLYLYEEKQAEALSLLNLKGLEFEVRTLQRPTKITLKLPSKLKRINSLLNKLRDMIPVTGSDSRNADLSGVEAYLQFDQMQYPPKVQGLKTTVILYDLIPYVMEADYLWGYKTARLRGYSVKAALRKSFLRKHYITQVRTVCKTANRLVAISHHTKQDFMKYAGVPDAKIKVAHLGVESPIKTVANKTPIFERYTENSWGYFSHHVDLKEKPFVLFVGGADPRRKLIDLVAAFNNLKAQGHDLQLVLAGDTMKGPGTIPILDLQKYLSESSYLDDIIFLGFVTNTQREWLYKNTLTFVYPSVYEGFGLPILEAMQYGTPVITYKNTSIYEIAGEAALYANDALSIKKAVEMLLSDAAIVKKYSQAGRKQAAKYPWHSTVKQILDKLSV